MFWKRVAILSCGTRVLAASPRSLASQSTGKSHGSHMAREHYRADGVRIVHDPYAPGMAEKYGVPGRTDNEGFDPYADSVGAGIYGGVVKRNAEGRIVIGRQYQNHNPKPGPVYAGGGYTPINNALRSGKAALKPLLDKYPDLVNDISTGGAQPLHVCGMSKDGQNSTAYLISRGADIEALDTYGFTPLLRMASNNLAVGAEALLQAGADPQAAGTSGITPLQMAQESQAADVLRVLQTQWTCPVRSNITVSSSGTEAVNQEYLERNPTVIPVGFSLTCSEMGWDSEHMWTTLSDQKTPWYEARNGAYVYFNRNDGQWWIDAPDGAGVYVVKAAGQAPPEDGWQLLSGSRPPLPRVEFHPPIAACGA